VSIGIDQTEDNGDGTVTVYATSPAHHRVHVVVGHDMIANGQVYAALDLAAARADTKAAALAAHDEAQTQGG